MRDGCVFLCMCAYVGVIPAPLSIHVLRESSKYPWMTHITTGSVQFSWSFDGIVAYDNLQLHRQDIVFSACGTKKWKLMLTMQTDAVHSTETEKDNSL